MHEEKSFFLLQTNNCEWEEWNENFAGPEKVICAVIKQIIYEDIKITAQSGMEMTTTINTVKTYLNQWLH